MSSLPGAGEYGSPGHHPARLLSPRDGLCQAEKEKENNILLLKKKFTEHSLQVSNYPTLQYLAEYLDSNSIPSAICCPLDCPMRRPPAPRSKPRLGDLKGTGDLLFLKPMP